MSWDSRWPCVNPDNDDYTWCQLKLGDAALMVATRHDPERAPTPGSKPLIDGNLLTFATPTTQ